MATAVRTMLSFLYIFSMSNWKIAQAAKVTPRVIQDHEVLTQFGIHPNDPVFRRAPRFPGEHDLSLLLGRYSAKDAGWRVLKRAPGKNARVRYVTAGALRARKFIVTHTPNLKNPDHVSVTVADSSNAWNNAQQDALDNAFNDAKKGGIV